MDKEKEGAAAQLSESNEMTFIFVATFLPLKSWKHMISFLLMTWKILKQIKQTEGVVNYAINANFPRSISGPFRFGKINLHFDTS